MTELTVKTEEAEPTEELPAEIPVNTDTGSNMGTCCKCMFWTVSVIVAILAMGVGGLYVWFHSNEIPEEIAMHLGPVGVQTFKAFDRNNDGYISIEEFEPMYHHLLHGSNSTVQESLLPGLNIEYPMEITPEDEVITVVPRLETLEVTSMMKDVLSRRGIIENLELAYKTISGAPNPLQGYLDWTQPNKKYMNIAVKSFQSFLPLHLDIPLGLPYYIIQDRQSFLDSLSVADISSNRYFPPHVPDEHVIIHTLLTLFHPRPFIISRFGPRGAVAAVRARNDKYMDIVFRIHAEFQLNELPNYPFWYTPAQFTGHLIITADLKHIVHFNMYVPNDKQLNVDMEWMEGGDNMVVDIGYMPQMSLSITSHSVPVDTLSPGDHSVPADTLSPGDHSVPADTLSPGDHSVPADTLSPGDHSVPADTLSPGDQVPSKQSDVDNIVWTEEMSEEDAFLEMEKKMYPFKQVRYYNFTESLELSSKEDKPLHHILLWGALDDQSC